MKQLLKKLVIITEPPPIYFGFPKKGWQECGAWMFIIKYNKFLAKHTIKNEISQLLSN